MSVQHGMVAERTGSRSEPVGAALREELQRILYERISPEAIARMSADDPERARASAALILRRAAAARPNSASIELEEVIRRIVADTIGLGAIDELMRDPSVSEVMVNGLHSIYCERGGRLHRTAYSFDSDEQIRTVIDRLIAPAGRRVDERSPLVSARVAGGHRAHAVLPPVSVDGPVLTVRKFASDALNLRELVEAGSLSPRVASLLSWAVRARLNVAVSGGTGSGKTTLLNALAGEIDAAERVITIEDSAELKFHSHPHVVRLEAREQGVDGSGAVTIRDLVVASLRMRPDRIVVGEVRGAEALEMLQAMNTGHDGSLTTLHANAPQEVPARLVTMVGYGATTSREQVLSQVASALDLIVHVARTRQGFRYVTEMCEVGPVSSAGELELRSVANARSGASSSRFASGGGSFWEIDDRCSIPSRAVAAGVATPEEVDRWRELPL